MVIDTFVVGLSRALTEAQAHVTCNPRGYRRKTWGAIKPSNRRYTRSSVQDVPVTASFPVRRDIYSSPAILFNYTIFAIIIPTSATMSALRILVPVKRVIDYAVSVPEARQ